MNHQCSIYKSLFLSMMWPTPYIHFQQFRISGFMLEFLIHLYSIRDKSLVSSACPKNKHHASSDLQEAKNISTFMTKIYFSFLFFSTLDLTFVYQYLIHSLSDFNPLPWKVNLHLVLVLERYSGCRDAITI